LPVAIFNTRGITLPWPAYWYTPGK